MNIKPFDWGRARNESALRSTKSSMEKSHDPSAFYLMWKGGEQPWRWCWEIKFLEGSAHIYGTESSKLVWGDRLYEEALESS